MTISERHPDAALPPEIESLISRVVKRARLRRGERRDVERELRSHFAEGIVDGKSAPELVAEFGDAKASAKMIGRAKRRCRGMVWHAWVWSCRGVMALFALVLAMYAWAAWNYYRPVQVSNAKHEARMFAAMGLTAEHKGDAWKAYREFRDSIPEEWEKRRDALLRTTDPWLESEWADAGDLIALVRPLIDETLPSIKGDRLGYTVEDWRNDPDRSAKDRSLPLMLGYWPLISDYGGFYNWIKLDLWFAWQTGDTARVERLVLVLLDMAEQSDSVSIMVMQELKQAMARSVANWVLDETTKYGVSRLQDLQTVDLVLDRLRVLVEHWSMEAEEVVQEDLVTLMYGGEGEGIRVRGAGWRATLGSAAFDPPDDREPWWAPNRIMRTPLAPVASFAMPTYRESIAKIREWYAETTRYVDTPLWEDFQGTAGDSFVDYSGHVGLSYQSYPFATNLPATDYARHRRPGIIMLIDAARTAIAIESYRRDHGECPSTLEALVPSYMPLMPIDQSTGKPLAYRITEEGPVVYSLGLDRDDDGGMPVYDDKGKVMPPGGLIDPGQWAGYDAEHQVRYDGDYVLWPVCPCPELPAKFPPENF